jgi:DNA-binding GntR family transcriptional regulator
MTFSQIRAMNLREQVVEQIRTAIIEGRLKPNDHIVESSLTQMLGISRTPVREALILLEQDGLVVSYPNRGSYVRNFTAQDVDEVFSMRTMLENFAGELSIDHYGDDDYQHLQNLIAQQQNAITAANFRMVRSIDMSFHQFIVNKSGHALLTRNWQQIVAQIAAILYMRAEAIPDYDEYLAIRDHTAILSAYRDKNLPALSALNRKINERVAGECRLGIEFKSRQTQ